MKRYLLPFLLLPSLAQAQSLQEQIESVHRVEVNRQRTEDAARTKAAAEEQKRAAQKAEQERQERARVDAAIAAKNVELHSDKQRDQLFEDKVRDMQLEDAKLDLEMKRAKVNRANDYIEQELKAQAADTDVVQSRADVARNIADGAKEKMKSEGKAEERKAGGSWWPW